MKFADDSFGRFTLPRDHGVREVEADSAGIIAVESDGLLFRGDYVRDGADLIVQGDGETLIVHGYFSAAHRPKLVAPNGASLSDAVIDALARPLDGIDVAQAGAPPASDASAAIGRVQTLSGSATVVRNGVSVALQVGDLVYKGDAVQTGAGSSLAISFLDGTLFSLAASARMVLSEMVYSASGADNHSLFNLVQGSIHFVAGKVAKTGDMKVGTPLATMGIRGTFVGAEIDSNDGTSRVGVITEPPTPEHPEGQTGAFEVYSGQGTGNLLFRVVDPNLVWTLSPDGSGGVSFRSDPKTPEELAREAQLTRDVFQTLAEAPRLPVFNGPPTGGGAGSGNQPGQFEPNLGPPSGGPGNPGPTLPPGPPGPAPLPPGPTPPPTPNGPDAPPPVVTGPSNPAPGLTVTPRAVALGQGDLREGLGEQGLLAGTPGAQLLAVRAPGATQDVAIAGTVTLQGRYGLLTLHADGTYSYRAVYAAALGEGQAGADLFGLTVGRGGATVTTTLSFDVTGRNDAPTVSGPMIGQAGEGGAAVSLNALAHASDIDAGTRLAVVNVPAELPPGVSYDAATKVFRLDPSNATYQSLAAGETRTVTIRYGVSDGLATTPAKVTWAVTGVNDDPMVTGAVTGTALEDGSAVRLGALANASDVDAGTRLGVVGVPAELPPGVSYDGATKTFSLDPSNAAYQNLAAGETRTVTVRYGVSDGTATTPASVTWTVTGTNDAPTVVAALTRDVREGAAVSTLDLLAGATDVDAGDGLRVEGVTYAVEGGVATATAPAGLRLAGARLTLDPADPVFEALAQGETRTILIRYTVADGHGGTVAQSATLTITGTNDAPSVTGAVVGAAREDRPAVSLEALANASDVDHGARLGVVAIPADLPPGVSYDGESAVFRLDPSNAAYQSLAAGETRTVTVRYGVSDGLATTPASVTWTVTGANDAPVVTGAVTGTAVEDGAAMSLKALANASDVDAGAQLRVVDVPAALPAGVSYDAATKTFRLDPSDAAYQSLAAGQTRTVSVEYGVSDGLATTPASVSWTVTGLNDAPMVTDPVTGNAPEDGAAVRLDALARASDVDAGTRLRVVDVPAALPPGVGYDPNTQSFHLDPSDAAYQNLAAGQSLTVTVSYGVSDGLATTPASVSWTVTGVNDVPVVSGPVTGSAREDGAASVLAALANATDADAGASLRVVDVPANLPPGVSYDPNTQSFQLDPSDADYQNLAAGQTRTVTVSYGVGDGTAITPASVSWTVTGVNDAPVVSGPVTGSAVEDGAVMRLSALAHATDVDAGTQLQVVGVTTELPAGVSYDPNTQSFRLDPSDPAYQSLAEGQSLTVSVAYGVSDGRATVPASVSWTLTGTNDAPTIGGDRTIAVSDGGSVVLTRADLAASDPDANAGPFTYTIDPAANPDGYFSISEGVVTQFTQADIDAGRVVYHRDETGAGEPPGPIGFTLDDGAGGVTRGSLTVTAPENSAPTVAEPLTSETQEGAEAYGIDLLTGASDPDGDALTPTDLRYTIDGAPTEGMPWGLSLDGTILVIDPRDEAFADLADGETRTIVVAYTLDDGHGGTVAQTATITVTGTGAVEPDPLLPTRADHVVLAEPSEVARFVIPVEALLFNDVGADGIRPNYFGITALEPTESGRYEAAVTSGGGSVTVSPNPQSSESEPAFTYRAYDGADRGSEVATVSVSLGGGVEGRFVAGGSGAGDDILIAASSGSTLLDGNRDGLFGTDRSGHDVFVFAQDPTDGTAPIHRIADFSAENDALDLTFLAGSGASAETIAEFVTIAFTEGGYDLYARRDPEAGMTLIAHIDAVSRVGEPGSETFLTVIWRDHLAAVALPQLIPT